MEKAILETLIYANIFDYPLTVFEIHRWLINKQVTLRRVEKALKRLYQVSRIKHQGGYYFLPKGNGLVSKRIRKEKQSILYFRKAKILAQLLKLIPWVKLVGVSGGLSMNNVSKSDDIDLFIITAKKRLWISRLICLGLLSLVNQRRRVGEKGRKIAGKLCLNILLEEDKLEQQKKDIFIAHEVLQMRPLWYRGGIYSKYLEDNSWVFEFLPNWIHKGVASSKYYVLREKTGKNRNSHNTKYIIHNTILDNLETLAKSFQLWYMKKPTGLERIEEGALYFHPKDCRQRVLSEYKKKLSGLLTPATSD